MHALVHIRVGITLDLGIQNKDHYHGRQGKPYVYLKKMVNFPLAYLRISNFLSFLQSGAASGLRQRSDRHG